MENPSRGNEGLLQPVNLENANIQHSTLSPERQQKETKQAQTRRGHAHPGPDVPQDREGRSHCPEVPLVQPF